MPWTDMRTLRAFTKWARATPGSNRAAPRLSRAAPFRRVAAARNRSSHVRWPRLFSVVAPAADFPFAFELSLFLGASGSDALPPILRHGVIPGAVAFQTFAGTALCAVPAWPGGPALQSKPVRGCGIAYVRQQPADFPVKFYRRICEIVPAGKDGSFHNDNHLNTGIL